MFCHVLLLAAVALQLLGPCFPFPRVKDACLMENTLPSVVADSQVVVALLWCVVSACRSLLQRCLQR
jgi:hypothetical protein